MKSSFLSLLIGLAICSSAKAVDYNTPFVGYASSINADSGVTGSLVTFSGMTTTPRTCGEVCTKQSHPVSIVAAGASCPLGYSSFSNLVGNTYQCCYKANTVGCQVPLTDAVEEKIGTASNFQGNADLESVFGDRTNKFWGYVNDVIRSPNAGRTLIMDAKLDLCIGFTNLDALVTSYPNDPYGAWSTCTGSGYCGSVKNAYCTNNSNQVCLDRCNCKYQSALVGLGYPDPGCSNL